MWTWIAGGLLAWIAVALGVAVVLGRGVAMAERAERAGAPVPGNSGARAPRRRRPVPVPPVGIALAAGVCALMTAGYVVRLTGVTGQAARVWSMDAPHSVPRTSVAVLLAVAAVAAAVEAARSDERRAWWSSVALVAGVLAAVKYEGTVHVRVMSALAGSVGVAAATVLAVVASAVVLAVLAFVSRAERRDRRRVLTGLGCYAGAAVGLSALATAVGQLPGSGRLWLAAATYVEESAEGLAAVAVLVAVLVGVAPRLVLPASWVLRRQGDEAALRKSVRGQDVAPG